MKCRHYCKHHDFYIDWDENNKLMWVRSCNAEDEKRELVRTQRDDPGPEIECHVSPYLLLEKELAVAREAESHLRDALLMLEEICLAIKEDRAKAEQATEQTERQSVEVSAVSREVA